MDVTAALEKRNAFWVESWATGQTGWKSFESSASVRRVLELTSSKIGKSLDHLRGLRVLVPLCGDTPALDVFYRLGACVTGVELTDAAVTALRSSFGSTASWTQSAGEGFTQWVLGEKSEAGGTLTVCHGDIFVVLPQLLKAAKGAAPFDLVYDRASLVALSPETQRLPYTALIRQALEPSGRIILELVDRTRAEDAALAADPAHIAAGPPHHIDSNILGDLFGAERNFVPVEECTQTCPRFAFCVYVTL
jgi:hypothetical protein